MSDKEEYRVSFMDRKNQEKNQFSAQGITATPPGKKPSIKTITVRNMANFLLFASLVFLIIVGISFRMISYNIIISKTIAISEVVIAGLTSSS